MSDTASIQDSTLYALGVDQTAALQALYDQSQDGDTITLRPRGGVRRFYHSVPLDWTGTKSVFVNALGCEIYYQGLLSGTQASITWGGSPGTGVNAWWQGGNVMGALAVQNVSYSRHIDPEGVGTLIVQANNGSCSYNDFHISGMAGGAGNGSALIFNQINQNDWCNCNVIHSCSMRGTPVNGQPSPVIWQVNQTVNFNPSGLMFRDCRFEGAAQILLDVGLLFACTFDCCYFEGDWQQGTGGGKESFTWHDMPAKRGSWLSDYRNIQSGVVQ